MLFCGVRSGRSVVLRVVVGCLQEKVFFPVCRVVSTADVLNVY